MLTLRPRAAAEMAASLAIGLVPALPAHAADAGAAAADAVAADAAADPSPSTIVVTGHRDPKIGLDRLATPIADTPQAITTISSAELTARGVTNLNDALRNVAGLSLGAGETSFQGNNAILRGFTTRNDLFVDNARDYGYYFRDTFDDERVEVLKGPSSTLFGRGSTGGVIHRVTKAPQLDDAFSAEGQLGTADVRRLSVDANFGKPIGETTGFRLNAVFHHSAVAARDTAFSERWAVAPKFAWGLGTATRLRIAYTHQEEHNRPDYGIPWLAGNFASPGFPAPVRRDNYYGFDNDRLNTVVNIVTGRIEHDFGPETQLRTQLRYSNNTRDFRYSEAIIPAGTPRSTPLDAITVSRNLFQGASRDRFLQSQTEIETVLRLGPLVNRIVAGVEVGTEATDPVYTTNFNVPATSLARPVGGFYDSVPNSFVRLRGRARSHFLGLYAIDAVELGDHWRAVLALRWDSFQTRYDSTRFNAAGVADRNSDVDRTDRRLSYRGALVYKPVPAGSVYVSYANSFNPSGEGIESLISAGRSVAEANLNLAPETSESVEAGAKWQLFGNRALLSASLFRITKNNARVPDPGTPGFNSLGGTQRVDGAEIEFGGSPLPGWSLRASYAWLDSKTLASSPAGPLVGAPLLITPRHSASVSTAYDLTPRLNLGLNVVLQSQRLGQNNASSYLVAGGYVVADLSAAYRVSDRVTLRLLVNNVFDRLYYDQLHPAHVIPGAGRSALFSLGVRL